MTQNVVRTSTGRAVFAALLLSISGLPLSADEGMWLFNAPPWQLLRERHGFEPAPAWLDHLRKASLRFNSGGSGSFVSEAGLILSNHHVGLDALQKLGDAQHDYVRDGFSARTLADEKRCLDLELNVLVDIEDVTERVNAAVNPNLPAEQASSARRGILATIEKESLDRTGLRSDVVTLYQGGQYHLYRYKKYTDVRLVFAPEQQIAFFGGDPDNFEYPRCDLDICLFRAYEDGQPARIPDYLQWNVSGVRENELVFVSGHPGNTSRLLTVAELESLRASQASTLRWLKNTEVLLDAYSQRSQENARQAKRDLFGTRNSRKVREGELAGLLDPALMARKQAEENQLRRAVAARPELQYAATAWEDIVAAESIVRSVWDRHFLLESGLGRKSPLLQIARTLLRAAEERPKPNAERLAEFGEAGRESLEFQLFSEKPVYPEYERIRLADTLTWLANELGPTNEIVRRILNGRSPRQRAAEAVGGTRIQSVAVRRQLYDGGKAAVAAARDPMIELAWAMDAEARAVREVVEAQEEIKQQAHARIERARFALEGAGDYPDATFTLRLAFGVVKGYPQDGQTIPFATDFAGLYRRAEEHAMLPPFDLPERWLRSRKRLNLQTQFNFVCTADITGGNSGSPVVNRDGELVGLIFDGNIQSLIGDVVYTEEQARAVSVSSAAIVEALRKVYRAPALAEELTSGKRRG